QGVLVTAVRRGSWASRIGLRNGDIVLAVNDEKVRTVAQIRRATASPQDVWRLEIQRGRRVLRVEVG
ncbi:MAG: PDZ domain-containing protein, partial [Alphaproteobacteria bacterium]|nr:PDZ domain-containing protein [Alphaproteobacteria bacterium]